MKTLLVCAGILLTTSTAWAAPPSLVLSAERVWGISHSTQSFEGGGDSQDTTSIGLGASPLGQGGIYSAPRLGIDYVTASGFSVGGALGVQSVSGEGNDTVNGTMLAPRVGYFTMAGSSFGIWPRAGLSYWSMSLDGNDLSYTALTLEMPLALFVVDSAALFVTPHIDLGIGGGTDNTDSKVTEIGLHFGVAAFL